MSKLIRMLSIIAVMSLTLMPCVTSSQEGDTRGYEIPEGNFGIVGIFSTASQTVRLFFYPQSISDLALYDAFPLQDIQEALDDNPYSYPHDTGDLALFEIWRDGEDMEVADAWYINLDDLGQINHENQSTLYVGIEKYAGLGNDEIIGLLDSLRTQDDPDHIELWTNWDATVSNDAVSR